MFEIQEKQKVLPDGTRLTTFTREVTSANALEIEAGTNGLKGGNERRTRQPYLHPHQGSWRHRHVCEDDTRP